MPLYELTVYLEEFPSAIHAAEFAAELAAEPWGWTLAPPAPGQPGMASRHTRAFEREQDLLDELERIKTSSEYPIRLSWGELTSGRDPYAGR